jgi:hypothetical protein
MRTEFPLIGLSAGNRCTLSPDETDRDWFHAPTNLAKDRFQALFDYFKEGPDDVWKSKPRAIVQHDGLFESGIPKNPVVIEVILP